MILPENDHLLFVDVETPNRRQDAICSIAAIRTTREGEILEEFYSLVDPECEFDPFNIRIHGITPEDVRGIPTFAKLWEFAFEELFDNARLIAHNNRFDMHVIAKTMATYGINFKEAYTADSRSGCLSGSLDKCAEKLGFPLDHHNALSDVRCCKEVFFYNRNLEDEDRFDDWTLWQKFDFEERKFKKYSERSQRWI